jgi:hypothetical protein
MGVQNQVYHKIALMRGKGVINWFNQWIQGHPVFRQTQINSNFSYLSLFSNFMMDQYI